MSLEKVSPAVATVFKGTSIPLWTNYCNHLMHQSHVSYMSDCARRYIFILLHNHMSDHWYLLVMNLDERTAEILDSKPDVHLDDRRMVHAKEAVSSHTIFFHDIPWHWAMKYIGDNEEIP